MFLKIHFLMVKGVNFHFFLNSLNITLVIIEISMARDLSFQAVFFNNYDGNMYISFQDLHDSRGVMFQNVRSIFIGAYERGLVIIDITMSCDISISMIFSQLKQ